MAERISTPGGARLLGQRIADARKNLNKSQGNLSDDTGVERSLISKLESGRFKTLNGSVQKICTVLGLDPQNPGGDQHIEAMVRRISALSVQTPQLLAAINGVLDVLESANQGKR